MNKLLNLLLASAMMCAAGSAFAAEPATGDVPPAHQQKKAVPDSTKNGDYLQDQQDNNSGNTGNSATKQSKPGSNMEKSKRFHEKPAEGGTNVNQQGK